ncbi:MAG TPA: glycosyltransferase family 2 protein [Chthoniobacterales bacterium]|nr:glycosyltransferase family 2 protein [Chthoniobacterales bacterium]
MSFDVPILFLVFSRPEKTAEVFQAIRKVRPSRLFVVADGPRPGVPDDERRCEEVRRLIQDGIDWDCDFTPLFRPENLGCRRSVSQGITWFFEQVEEGIVLEDDTLPVDSFFPYCRELLAKYRDDPRVMHIGGDNFHFGRKRGQASYYVSKYPYIWGWATWRRAWRHYDVDLTSFQAQWSGIRKEWVTDQEQRRLWKHYFELVVNNEIDTWDFQWTYALFARRGLSLLPNRNLVTNIGFGADASHTGQDASPLSRVPLEEMGRLTHPGSLDIDHVADSFVFTHMVMGQPMPKITWRERFANLKWKLRNP